MNEPNTSTALSEIEPAPLASNRTQSQVRRVGPSGPMDAIDREFLPSALEILDTPPSPGRVAVIWIIVSAFTIALAWAWFGQIEIHAIATGRIQPSGRSKVVQPFDSGRITSILVENGQKVEEGDLLLVLDPTEATADRTAQELELQSSQAETVRRRAALASAVAPSAAVSSVVFPWYIQDEIAARERLALEADLAQLSAALKSLEAQRDERIATRLKLLTSINSREKLVSLAGERAAMRERLEDRGALSRAMVIDVLQQYEIQVVQLATERGQLLEIEALLKTIDRRREELSAQFISDQTQKLLDAERRIAKMEQDNIKARARQERSRIHAPVSGLVQQVSVTTTGQVVASGQPLLTIVPLDATLEVEALILNKDIGFVREGQSVVVKIDAFPFTRYGMITGRLRRISREAIDQNEAQGQFDPKTVVQIQGPSAAVAQKSRNLVFATTITLSRQSLSIDGADVLLTSGMTVTAEILTGNRRILDFVLSPLIELATSSGHER